MNMTLDRIFATAPSTRNLVLRLLLAAVIFPHGAQKLLGWFGGYGFTGTMGYFTGTVHVPYLVGLIVIVAESFGALAIAAGLFTRAAALAIAASMIGAALSVHAANGWFMNWFATMPAGTEGIEYFLPVLGLAGVLAVEGAGRASADAYIARRLRAAKSARASSGARSADEAAAPAVR
jgi:putative oxidoreductase